MTEMTENNTALDCNNVFFTTVKSLSTGPWINIIKFKFTQSICNIDYLKNYIKLFVIVKQSNLI
jgi:hypothetical protein